MDYACLAGQEYTALLVHFCVGKTVSNEALQILEGVQILGKPVFTTVVLQAFTLPKQNVSQEIKDIRQLLPALGDSHVRGLREQVKLYVVDHFSNHVRELQSAFLVELSAGNPWNDAAIELLTFTHGLHEETWLLVELDHSIQQFIISGPPLITIETLGIIRNCIGSATTAMLTPLLSQVDAYCKARLMPDCAVDSQVRELIEALIDLWQQHLDWNYRELALLIANFVKVTSQFRCKCLKDITTLTLPRVISTLEALKFPNGDLELGVFTLIKLLASEDRLESVICWRRVLLFTIENQHEALLHHALTQQTPKIWLELLGNIRVIYKGSDVIRERGYPKFLSLELHTWSQQIQIYLPTLMRLKSVLKHGPAMQMLLLGSAASKNGKLLRVLHLIKNSQPSCRERLMDNIIVLLCGANVDDIEDALSAVSKASSRGIEACLAFIHSKRLGSASFTEVLLASKLRAGDISEPDRLTLMEVSRLSKIGLDAEGNVNTASLKEVTRRLHEEYLKLITEAQRLENLRLSLEAVAPQDVSELLLRLHIEAPTFVEDTLASLPPSLGSIVERVSKDVIELHFPATKLTKLQRFAIGAGDDESFLIRLTLRHDAVPIKFCIHLSNESKDEANSKTSSTGKGHTPWEIFRGNRPPHEQYCRGRSNRGVYQLSRILWRHLRHNFESLEKTHKHVTSKLSTFGQGCVVYGIGQRRLRRATTCPSPSCQSTFLEAHIEIQLAEIWQDPSVMDLLLTMIYAAALTGKMDLLANCPTSNAPVVVGMLDNLPPIPTLAKHLKSCLNVSGKNFRLAQALVGYCNPITNSPGLADGLLWACSSYGGFLVSATGSQRIPSFGNNQFLLANAAPDLEIAFSRHMPTPNATSWILFHGTSLDRLHAIFSQGMYSPAKYFPTGSIFRVIRHVSGVNAPPKCLMTQILILKRKC